MLLSTGQGLSAQGERRMSTLIVFLLCLIPRPDLVSVEIASVQAGAGLVQGWTHDSEYGFLFPDFGVSAGQARLYWGKNLAFAAGLELFRGEGAYTSSTGVFGTCEVLMPEIGGSVFLHRFGPSNLTHVWSHLCLLQVRALSQDWIWFVVSAP